MFTRLIRLGLEVIHLNDQGRCRPSIMELFKWRYPTLKNLPNVHDKNSIYGFANAGFRFDYQFVNVPEFNGKGETAPRPHFYQNLAEAEYIVATYMFMVLIGYSPDKITILTTYNGQKYLIRDIIHQKCSWNPIFKKPKISTVDKFQGQQNDYILMSLVRTESVGHFRDPRRLTVAFSRARLGLYVFGSYDLFNNCYELRDAFRFFQHRPRNLLLVQNEKFPSKREIESSKDPSNILMVEGFQELYKVVQKLLEEKI
jgi:intron-binding protein aquarius